MKQPHLTVIPCLKMSKCSATKRSMQNVTNEMSSMEELAGFQTDDNESNTDCGWSERAVTWPSWVCLHLPHVLHADWFAKNLGQLLLIVTDVAFQHVHAGPHQPLKGLHVQHWNRTVTSITLWPLAASATSSVPWSRSGPVESLHFSLSLSLSQLQWVC